MEFFIPKIKNRKGKKIGKKGKCVFLERRKGSVERCVCENRKHRLKCVSVCERKLEFRKERGIGFDALSLRMLAS